MFTDISKERAASIFRVEKYDLDIRRGAKAPVRLHGSTY
jgi:hypothetical protein